MPPLITREKWDEIRRAFSHLVHARRGRKTDDPYLLRGRLTCGHCHGALRTIPDNGVRYYKCGCRDASSARYAGKPVCDLPAVHAVDLEAELWRLLRSTLLDPDALCIGLDAAQAQHAESDRLRQERLDAHDAELAKQHKRLDALTSRLADVGDGEVYASILRQAKEFEEIIAKISAEHAAPADRRRLYELLQVRGTVSTDPDGIRLGRKHHFRIDWQAAIPLSTSDSNFLKSLK